MDIRKAVREFYGNVADGSEESCCAPSCCGADPTTDLSALIGYTQEQLAANPQKANLGLGCGNPTALAGLAPGDVVLDLGAGAGIDCFLAAPKVGPKGRVIGVDMTASMVSRAREVASEGGYDNVEFRLGEIEHLPIPDGTVDVVISNCVVNLSPDKQRVFDEVHRALRPGGRVSISDIVAISEVPSSLRASAAAVAGCVGNAEHVDTVRAMLESAGFEAVDVKIKPESATLIDEWLDGASQYVASATISARKPQ